MTEKVLIEEIGKFKSDQLNKVTNTVEKNVLPTTNDIWCDLLPDGLPSKKEVIEISQNGVPKLKNVDTVEKNLLPTTDVIKEEKVNSFAEVNSFDIKKLNNIKTQHHTKLPSLTDILFEKVETRSEIKVFDSQSLKHIDTNVHCHLPTINDIYAEMLPDNLPSKAEVQSLKQGLPKLKPATVTEKSVLPTLDDINMESVDARCEVIGFNKSKLKNVETQEKNSLPNANVLRAELIPDNTPIKSELGEIISGTTLKKCESNEKNTLPKVEDITAEKIATRAEVKSFDKTSLKKVDNS